MILKTFIYIIIISNKVCFSQNITTTVNFYEEPSWVPRVVNGKPARLGDVPYQVALKALVNRFRREYKTFCGATIIAETKLLTAAHCFEGGNSCEKLLNPGKATKAAIKNKAAVAGNLYNKLAYVTSDSADGQWRSIHSVYFPKGYKFPKHDIAVAFLNRPFHYTNYIKPIPMASQNTDYHGECLVSGYGRTGQSRLAQTEILLLANLVIMPKKYCNKVHHKNMDNFVCTSSTFTDVGKGDSGGPLVCANTGDPNESGKGVLVGVVSGHSRGRGSFFTRVSKYSRFIKASKSQTVFMFKYHSGTYMAISMTLIYKTLLLF